MERFVKIFKKSENTTFFFQGKPNFSNYFLIGAGVIKDKLCDSDANWNWYKTGVVFVFGENDFCLGFIKKEKRC